MASNPGKLTNGFANSQKMDKSFGKPGKAASVKHVGRTPRQNAKAAQNIIGTLKRRSANKTQVGF